MSRARRLARDAFDAVFENFLLKLLSLAAAIGLFAYHHSAENAVRSFSVSVVALVPKEDRKALVSVVPSSVQVTVRGARRALDDLHAEDLGNVQLDLRSTSDGSVSFDATRLRLPAGLTPTIEPPSIEVRWDDVITRTLPLQVAVVGQPLPGFAVVGQPTVEPSTITARGPKRTIETLQHARLEAFEVTNLGEGVFSRKIQLEAPPPHVTWDATAAVVTVHAERAREERLFVKLPVQVVGVAKATTVPAEVDVRVVGMPSLVGALRPEQLVPLVDLKSAGLDGQRSGAAPVPVTVSLEGCTVHVLPSTVVVKW